VPVIKPAEQRDGNRAEREDAKFDGSAIKAVGNQAGGGNFDDAELEQNRAGGGWQENSRQHREAAGERNGRVVNFSVAGIVHQICAQTPFAPQRQHEQRRQKRARKGGGKKIEGKGHVRRPRSAASFR